MAASSMPGDRPQRVPDRAPLVLRKAGGNGRSSRALMVRGPINGALGRMVEIDTSPFPMWLDAAQVRELVADLTARLEEMTT